jgi:hypothetical protein
MIGGSVKNFSVAGRSFTVAADADVELDFGGYSNELQANGDLSARKIMTAKPWGASGLSASIDHNRDDMAFLQGCANGKDAGEDGLYDMTVTLVNNVTFQGRGTVADDLKFSTQNSTCDLTLSGSGELTKQ